MLALLNRRIIMEANELYNFSVFPLVTGTFALEWSPDNHVSLITERGVHVFELAPHPSRAHPTLRFWRTFIYPSDYVPARAYAKFVNEVLWGMEREEIYQLLLQEALTPNIEDKTCPSPRITRVVWSPAGLADPLKCLATILTSAGGIEILYKFGNKWLSAWNLTERWSELIKEETKIDPAQATESSFERTWPEHVRRFLGTAIGWSPLLGQGKPFAYLAAAFRSSELIVARVERIGDPPSLEEAGIVYRRRLDVSSRIDQLLWIVLQDGRRHVIVVGCLDGRIYGLRVTENDGEFEDGTLLRYEDCADRARPSSFRSIRENGNHVILATKRSCLVVLTLDENGECARTRYLKIDGFSITGQTLVSNDRVLLTTQDCRMYIATIGDERDLPCVRVSHDLKARKVQYLGTAGSPNGTILINVTSPDSIYDHMINREPSSLQVFALKDEQWNPWSVISEKVRANRPLREYWDCVESLRVTAAKSSEPSKVLPEIPTSLNRLSIDELRMVYWLTLISRNLEKERSSSVAEKIPDETSEAQSLIFLIAGCEHLARLARKSTLTEEEKRSASFLRMYIEVCLAGEDEDEADASATTRKLIATFRESSHVATIETEACNLCGEVLSELPWTIDRCPLSHKLPRCSLSLLQITAIRYRSCPICERLFHPSLDREYEVIRCPYCDVPTAYDPRVRSDDHDDFEKRWKNLSQRPEADNSRISHDPNNPNGAPSTSEKVKRRCLDNPRTFAVIVNRDQNDDSLITETWQKF